MLNLLVGHTLQWHEMQMIQCPFHQHQFLLFSEIMVAKKLSKYENQNICPDVKENEVYNKLLIVEKK